MCDGFLNILKPPGMTSHDVVNWVRKELGIRKAGHTGTLDPGASGVLVIACNKATRLAELVQHYGKAYRAELQLGIGTDSHDAFGKVTGRKSVPALCRDEWNNVLQGFVGEIEQVLPMTSAVRVGGRRLYQLARQNIQVAPPKRRVRIFRCKLVRMDSCRGRLLFDVECSKGTYVRTLCADIAASVGTVGYMSFLLRTKVGPFVLRESQTLAECRGQPRFYPMRMAVYDWPAVTVDNRVLSKVRNGNSFSVSSTLSGDIAVYSEDGRLAALAKRVNAGIYRPYKVFV